MLRTKTLSTMLVASLAFAVGAACSAMPEADFDARLAEYKAKLESIKTGNSMKRDDALAVQKEFIDRFPLAEMTTAQLRELHRAALITSYKPGGDLDRTAEALSILEERTQGDSPEAVGALLLRAELQARTARDEAALEAVGATIAEAVRHPAAVRALGAKEAEPLWSLVSSQVSKTLFAELTGDIRRLADAFPADATVNSTHGVADLWERANAIDDEALMTSVESLRVRSMAVIDRALAAGTLTDRDKAYNERYLERLKLTPKVATLVGNPAPELDFLWTSKGESIRNLKDLRGRVVVLDFWATWCGPCVGSFPQVRELAAHYAGYPVEIVGVTSPQGSTIFEGGEEKAETPEIEFTQMERYIGEKDITWTVAFSKQEVFNPEYGIRGIPHVVIIDHEGKIAHRALHPASPLAKKADLIDPLLRAMGIEPPPAPKEEPAPAADDDGKAK